LITPDRFANGDSSNDRVEGVMDDFDRLDPSKRQGGDLRGVIDHLPYLQDLGVTAIWLNLFWRITGTIVIMDMRPLIYIGLVPA
jgi:hypothetical protein